MPSSTSFTDSQPDFAVLKLFTIAAVIIVAAFVLYVWLRFSGKD
jgi:hypothetical protein